MTLDAFVSQLAAHPNDEGLRLTFADWLLSQGDARGEAMALEGRDKRRLEALRKKHARAWLGALAEHADVDACVFRNGFPLKVVLLKTPSRVEPATVAFIEELELAAEATPLVLAAPRLRRLTATPDALLALRKTKPSWRLDECEAVIARDYAAFRQLSDDLDRLADIPALNGAAFFFSVRGYLEPTLADFIAQAVLRSGLIDRDVLGLHVREGAFDAVPHWLSWASSWGGGTRWTARYKGFELSASRDDDDRFAILTLSLDALDPIVIAAAATSLSQLQSLSPHRIDVQVPHGAHPPKRLLDNLRSAQRLLPSVSKLRVIQKKR